VFYYHGTTRAGYGDREQTQISLEASMPTYEFRCQRCGKSFEQNWSLAEYGKRIKEKSKCPACKSTRVAKTISLVEVKTAKKS
jgi:putative FmdB family regulatory protein